ncbi:MAG: extracellular solute-binding protein, partial [Chloroflexota bacterium]
HFTLYPPPAPTASNSAWQLLNKNLGVNFKMDILGAADYGAKLGSVIAGGSLPDIINIPPGATVPNFPQFLKADCQDLTAFLSGDAIKDYPNLAGYPTDAWKNVVYNGGIYGVPLPLDLTGDAVFVRQDWMSQAGVSMPTSGAEFKRVLQALTKPAQNHWGFAVVPSGGTNNGETGFGFFPQIFGAPNNWAVDSSGKFTKDIESDEYKQSLAYEADLWKAGVFEPSSTNYNQTPADGDFIGGKYAMHAILWVLYPLFTDRIGAGKVSYLPPFSANGGKPAYYLSRGYFSFVVLKKASSDRIKELLSILNYLGAPFGSQESLMTRYGVEGKDFAFDPQGNPQLTPQGQKDLPGNGAWSNLIQQPPVLYSNTHTKEYGQTMYNAEKQDLAVGIPDPTVGLFSNTQSNKGQLLAQLVGGKQTDIIFGRAPLSDWDQLLKDWRAQGGEQVRSEYQLAYAASKS